MFTMMEAGVGEIPENLTPEIVNDLYERGTEYLKTRVSYVFNNGRLHHNDWVVATWATYLSRSVILKKGSEEDKRNLPAGNLSNRPRPIGLKRRSGAAMAEHIAAAGDQPLRRRRRGPHTVEVPGDSDSGGSI